MGIQEKLLIDLLKKQWTSNYEAQQYLKSSSADRIIRFIRETPPEGYVVVSRNKDVPEGYNRCYEYRLVKEKYHFMDCLREFLKGK